MNPSEQINQKKSELRGKYRTLGRSLSSIQRASASSQIVRLLRERLNALPECSTIATFAGLREEADLSELHHLEPIHRWVYPKVVAPRTLRFYQVPVFETLCKGPFNLLEPNEKIHQPIDHYLIDLVIVPSVALAKNGDRLGKGGGFYDTLLRKLPQNASTVGICYQSQLLDSIPTTAHDQKVKHIITDAQSFPT